MNLAKNGKTDNDKNLNRNPKKRNRKAPILENSAAYVQSDCQSPQWPLLSQLKRKSVATATWHWNNNPSVHIVIVVHHVGGEERHQGNVHVLPHHGPGRLPAFSRTWRGPGLNTAWPWGPLKDTRERPSKSIAVPCSSYPEVGKVTLKINGDEGLSDESL